MVYYYQWIMDQNKLRRYALSNFMNEWLSISIDNGWLNAAACRSINWYQLQSKTLSLKVIDLCLFKIRLYTILCQHLIHLTMTENFWILESYQDHSGLVIKQADLISEPDLFEKNGPTVKLVRPGREVKQVGWANITERTVLFSSNHLYFRSWNMDGYVICQGKNGFYLRKSNVSIKNKILNISYNYYSI